MPNPERSRLSPPVCYHGSGGKNQPADRETRYSSYSPNQEQKE